MNFMWIPCLWKYIRNLTYLGGTYLSDCMLTGSSPLGMSALPTPHTNLTVGSDRELFHPSTDCKSQRMSSQVTQMELKWIWCRTVKVEIVIVSKW